MPNYMTMGIHTENGVPKAPNTRFHTDRNEAERQYCLYRAAAAISNYEVDTAVLMTIDGFVLESKTYTHTPPAPEPEPEPEPEVTEPEEPVEEEQEEPEQGE